MVNIYNIVLIIFAAVKYKSGELENFGRRNRTYDAFVCYSYNAVDSDFAENKIRFALEHNQDPPLKVSIHRRDFLAAWDIMWNIRNAIQNSNSAIVVMSQDYVDSLWCKEEFEQCYMEHMADPAFKLFVVMMQPADSLMNPSEYMKSFFQQKTYLDCNDSHKFDKIASYLRHVKDQKHSDSTTESDARCTT